MTETAARVARGFAVGGLFALAGAVFTSTVVLGPATKLLSDLELQLSVGASVALGCAAIAIVASALPRWSTWIATISACLVFGASLGYAIFKLPNDLGLINYTMRSHRSLALEDLTAQGPSRIETTNLNLAYALRRRIAGSDLILPEQAPFDDWQLKYRADLHRVERVQSSALPAAPSSSQVEAWRRSGLVLHNLEGVELVLPPNLSGARQNTRGTFAIVQSDATTFALVPAEPNDDR